MDRSAARTLTGQLADDLGWLEQHCRRLSDGGRAAGQLRMAGALVRNCVGPALNGQSATPLHVVVVGGAGAGKSTVSNMLSGATAAEANPQAGFTRHPIAYVHSGGPIAWAGHAGFLGPLQRLTTPSPSSLDQDVYQVRVIPPDPTSSQLLPDAVVWDCPDMTTWAASGYVPRLMEAAALADVIVYVASDERYNDEVPTQFLHLLLDTGKPVVVCLVKMREADAPALVAHFQKEIVGRMPPGIVGIVPIPFLTADQLADPARRALKYRIPVLNQVAVLANSTARRRTVVGATSFLTRKQDQLLGAARQDVEALNTWTTLVQNGQVEFEGRYNREYLTSERFRGFDEALVRLMSLLELPGVGKVLGGALYVIRTPYRLIKGWLGKAVSRPEAGSRPEQPVLEDALNGWADLLRKEAARRADTHPLWGHIAEGFHAGLGEQIRDRFQQGYRAFQVDLADEVERTARAIYEELEKNPAKLATLRSGKFALDVASIAGAIATGGIGLHDLVLIPVFNSITHQLVELLGKSVVDAQKEKTRQRQQELMNRHIAKPLAEWLGEWPATGGSEFERLRQALRRLPPAIKELETLVRSSTDRMA